MSTRRDFCSAATLALLTPKLLRAQTTTYGPTTYASTHVDIAAVDHDRILSAADRYLNQKPTPLTSIPAHNNPGSPQDFFSQAEDENAAPADAGKTAVASRPLFTAHSDALLNMSMQVAALTSAYLLTKEARYAEHAALHLRAWFIDPKTRMNPSLPCAALRPDSTAPRPEGILETVQLVEVAQAASFFTRAEALSDDELTALNQWFADYLLWLGTDKTALLTRDLKNHHGISWLLQAAAYARLSPEPNAGARKVPTPGPSIYDTPVVPNQYISLAALRTQFKRTTLRANIDANGSFIHELTTPWPYRNSLFALDMLSGICDLLSTRFETLWDFELQDGPSMRVAIAHYFPYIARRTTWPYAADISHFTELPVRHPSLLLCGRAYTRPEYVDLWKTLNPDPTDPTVLRSFPVRQPLLWIRRAPAM
jgi:Alginate lyase